MYNNTKLLIFTLTLACVFLQNTFVMGEGESSYDCYMCATNTDENDSPLPNGCMSNLSKEKKCSGQCYIATRDKKFRRGCIGSGPIRTRNDCENDKETCSMCESAFCNDKDMIIEQCFEAKYNISEPKPLGSPKKCQFISINRLGCYHEEKNGVAVKGCVSDLNEDKRKECANGKDCEICFNEKCNSKVVRHRECFHCDPSTNACSDPSDLRNITDCSYSSNACLVGVDTNGNTHRLCASTETEDTKKFPKGFTICETDKCNNQVFPANRLKCLHCKGDSDCELDKEDSKQKLKPKLCETYAVDEKCYTYIDEDGKVFRGCMSEKSKSTAECEKKDENCTKCNTPGCNEKPKSAGNPSAAVPVNLLISVTFFISILISLPY